MRKLIFVFLFSIFISTNIFSQEVKINKDYFKSYWKNSTKIIASPFRWKDNDWLKAGLVTVSGAMLYSQDLEIQKYFQSNRSSLSNDISKHGFEPIGSGKYSLPAMGLFYFHGLIFKNERSKRVGLLGVQAYILSGITVTVPKYAFQRHRPFQDTPAYPYTWDGPKNGYTHYTSFPSGHTTTAFAIATIVASEYKDKKIVPYLCYGAASLAGLSRMNDNKHWASDVLIGAAIGYAVGKLIYRFHPWQSTFTFTPAKPISNF